MPGQAMKDHTQPLPPARQHSCLQGSTLLSPSGISGQTPLSQAQHASARCMACWRSAAPDISDRATAEAPASTLPYSLQKSCPHFSRVLVQVPLRRVNQAYVIATSTKIDIGSVDSSKLADKNFTATTLKKSKQSQEDFFGKDAEPQKKVITWSLECGLSDVCLQRQLAEQWRGVQRQDPASCLLLPSCFGISGLCCG